MGILCYGHTVLVGDVCEGMADHEVTDSGDVSSPDRQEAPPTITDRVTHTQSFSSEENMPLNDGIVSSITPGVLR